MSLSGYWLIDGKYGPVGVTAHTLEKYPMKISIHDMNYENAELKGEWVVNLQYPVSQKDLDALCKRLPRFENSMGELYLVPEAHTDAEKRQCECH